MAVDWHSVKLGDLVHIKHGFAFKGEFFTDEKQANALITPGNFAIGGGFQENKTKYYSGPVPSEFVLEPGSVVVTMTDLSKASDTLGYSATVPGDLRYRLLHNQRIGLVELLDSERAALCFLHWVMRSPPYRHEVLASASGSTVRHTSPSRICAHRFQLPPLDEQRRIAAILGALDDKIELNRKMNRTLEELAQALFKSWFIDFDGHDDLVDSEIGPVPRGWEVGGIDALVEFDPTIPLRKGTEAVYADMKAIPTSGPAVSEWTRRAYAGGTRFQQGDTLLARITPCLENGKSALVDFLADGEVAFGSTEFIVLRPRPVVPRVWPYCLVRHEPFRAHAVANMTGSSGRQRVSAGALLGFRLALPPSEVLRRFGLVTDPLFDRITANTAESRTLTDLRDTLLPKLISGELRAPEAEVLVEAAG